MSSRHCQVDDGEISLHQRYHVTIDKQFHQGVLEVPESLLQICTHGADGMTDSSKG
jgi:hypothetical protein